ncbi:hypothetical protein J437_LFUL017161, partial [Ladona fulva]
MYDVQPKPFIDEVFHVRQAIRYCNGSFQEKQPSIQNSQSAFAIFCRQTNVVWVGFFALQIGLDSIKKHLHRLNRNRREPMTWKSILNSIMDRPHIHIPLVRELFSKEIGYIVTMALFTSFVIINKGIVVGDRQAHEAVINIPQLLYFYLFVIVFAFPYALVLVRRYIKFAKKDIAFVCGLSLIAISVTALHTHVHPYLLADNRHYTFYIWKRVYERHWSIRYLLTPVYLFGAFCVNSFISHKKFSFQIAFDMCVIVSLIPQKLLEFRYFILPYIILRLNLKLEDWWQLIIELAIYLSCNNSAFQTFALKTFYWNDSPDVQRII